MPLDIWRVHDGRRSKQDDLPTSRNSKADRSRGSSPVQAFDNPAENAIFVGAIVTNPSSMVNQLVLLSTVDTFCYH